jgi:hypothetical protein
VVQVKAAFHIGIRCRQDVDASHLRLVAAVDGLNLKTGVKAFYAFC